MRTRLIQLSQRVAEAIRLEIARRELGAQLRIARLDLEPLLVAGDVIAQNLRSEVLLEPREIGLAARHDLQPQRTHLGRAGLAKRDTPRRPVRIQRDSPRNCRSVYRISMTVPAGSATGCAYV